MSRARCCRLFSIFDSRFTIYLLMYCPSCGSETTAGLNYCNRCGASLISQVSSPIQLAPISLTKPILIIGAVILFLTLGGFAGIISGTIEMVQNGAGNVSPAIPVFGIPSLLTIDILLIRQLSKLISAALSPNRLPPPTQVAQPHHEPWLARPSTARLEPAPSVTENTTRFLEGTYRAPSETQVSKKQNQ